MRPKAATQPPSLLPRTSAHAYVPALAVGMPVTQPWYGLAFGGRMVSNKRCKAKKDVADVFFSRFQIDHAPK